MKYYLPIVVASLFAGQTLAGDDQWLSPVYKEIFQNELPMPPTKEKKYTYYNSTTNSYIDYYEIEIKAFEQQVYKGAGFKPAKLVGYDGISPGPTFRMEKGREAVVRFVNHAEKDISVHLHGSYSRAPFDGWAEDVTKKNQYKDYYYPNRQAARTLWYHDHAVHHTAENAYFGQAGFYILHDPEEDALQLPAGSYDLPLALAAKQYNSDGTLFDPASETVSLYGDVIHVNGQPWPYKNVEPRKYRLRFLDTSISRAFKLNFEDSKGKTVPFNVIASDAGLLTKPVPSNNLEISMAERWEVVIDFSAYKGQNITLKNARDVQADEDFNSTDKVMRFVVGTTVSSQAGNGDLPAKLRDVPFPPSKTGVDRHFKFERTNGEWKVNGVTFSDINNRILAKPPRGAIEIWELENGGGGWSHPVHIHLIDFQIISRTGGRSVLNYEKEALKDVVLLGTSETVRVIARYAPWDGVYMFHCHNLIHEDHDMMAAFNVTSLADWGYPETTKFIDPMEQRWRSKDYDDSAFTEQGVQDRLFEFYKLDAYAHVNEVEAALESYYANGPPKTPLATSTSASTSSLPATTSSAAIAPPAVVTTPATLVTSTRTTSKDDKKTSSTRTR
ncbi:oxidase cueO precursor [Bimuria novae-zelandiae CBS 107.79]|uniref:Oxidase cueO n=1 Tax=Bimuria novae-zelandiae CBS 107.79 TaxID=1447943 RepID=A0A6A5UYS1_9PLEO|nr:oxidase cueO precursor [Bimuria novae-zelandiae CBS 107.79]